MRTLLDRFGNFKIPFGCLIPTAVIAFAVNAVMAMNIVSEVIKVPKPTQDIAALPIALTHAWIQITQTALALPTVTPTQTNTPTQTVTASLVPTLASTSTSLPTATLIIFVPATQVPTLPAQAVCPCAGDSLNCSDFSSHSSAQSCFNYCVSQGAGDIHNLDGNADGNACESLP